MDDRERCTDCEDENGHCDEGQVRVCKQPEPMPDRVEELVEHAQSLVTRVNGRLPDARHGEYVYPDAQTEALRDVITELATIARDTERLREERDALLKRLCVAEQCSQCPVQSDLDGTCLDICTTATCGDGKMMWVMREAAAAREQVE